VVHFALEPIEMHAIDNVDALTPAVLRPPAQ
jgi:hypothetical protein